jgi:hypothetical protein
MMTSFRLQLARAYRVDRTRSAPADHRAYPARRRDRRGSSAHLRTRIITWRRPSQGLCCRHHGHLSIAKFPKETDGYSMETWEEIRCAWQTAPALPRLVMSLSRAQARRCCYRGVSIELARSASPSYRGGDDRIEGWRARELPGYCRCPDAPWGERLTGPFGRSPSATPRHADVDAWRSGP